VRSIRVLAIALLATFLLGSACVTRVPVNELLKPADADVPTSVLIDRINSYGEVRTFSAEAGIHFVNYFTGLRTKADKYPETTGLIRFMRPENTRMQVKFYSKRLADMVSDGQRFRLAIYWPDDKRRFIFGSNLKDLDRMDVQELEKMNDQRLKEAGGLVNMRPQHITDTFLIKPIADADRSSVFREEVRQVDPRDFRPGSKTTSERLYYVLYVVERDEKGQAKLRRKFWFDRTQAGTPLVRQQTFENGEGRLASDVWYSNWFFVEGTKQNWPGTVTIDRRADGYRLELTLVRDTVHINSDDLTGTFELPNSEGLPELDLDSPRSPEPLRKKPAVTQFNNNSPRK